MSTSNKIVFLYDWNLKINLGNVTYTSGNYGIRIGYIDISGSEYNRSWPRRSWYYNNLDRLFQTTDPNSDFQDRTIKTADPNLNFQDRTIKTADPNLNFQDRAIETADPNYALSRSGFRNSRSWNYFFFIFLKKHFCIWLAILCTIGI